MPPTSPAYDVFVSYASDDRDEVRAFVGMLKKAGLRVFFDEESIRPNEQTRDALVRGLQNSAYLVIWATDTWVGRTWATWEAEVVALSGAGRLIPIWWRDWDAATLGPQLSRLVGLRAHELDRHELLWNVYCTVRGQEYGARESWSQAGRHLASDRAARPVERTFRARIAAAADLADQLAVVRIVVLQAVGWTVDLGPAATAERDEAPGDGQLLIAIVGHRLGPGDGASPIERELHAARESGIPVLALIASRDWPIHALEDTEERRIRAQALQAAVTGAARWCVEFDPEPDRRLPALRRAVSDALDEAGQALTSSNDEPDRDSLPLALRALTSRRLPALLLGVGVYEQGPLGVGALVQSLASQDSPRSPSMNPGRAVATAAELHMHSLGSRMALVDSFSTALHDQSAQLTAPPLAHDLVAAMQQKLDLVVVTSWDMMLELRLGEGSVTIVSHVLRADHPTSVGKLAVRYPDGRLDLCAPQDLDLPRDGLVVYKPLGSPWLNHQFEADPNHGDQFVDTVVLTEQDHVELLRSHRVPAAIRRRLRRRPLLFLGYPLDVWHYRLVMHVFRQGRSGDTAEPIYVVSPAGTTLERTLWAGLPKVRLVDQSVGEFAAAALRALEPSHVAAPGSS